MRYAKFTKPLTISLSQATYDVLREISTAERKSMAELVREILDEMTLPLIGGEQTEEQDDEKDK